MNIFLLTLKRFISVLAYCQKIIFIVFLTLWPIDFLLAADFIVNQSTDVVDATLGNGVCDTDELAIGDQCSLRAAVQESNALAGDDTISLPAGTFTLSIGGVGEDAAATGDLDIIDNLTISGVDAASTVVDGGGLDSVIQVATTVTVNISNITIQNGNGAPDGGGIYNSGILMINNSTISGSYANNRGGGIFNTSQIALVNSIVSNNTADISGGGIYSGGLFGSTSEMTLTDSEVSDNSSSQGGGITNRSSTILNSSIVADNISSANHGGGIFNGDSLTLNRSIVLTNTDDLGGRGGGIFNNLDATLVANNSSILLNLASTGGGIFNDGAVILNNCVISGNIAPQGGGGGIYNTGGVYNGFGSVLEIKNTTISSNSAGDQFGGGPGGGIFIDVGTVNISNSTIFGNIAKDGFGGGSFAGDGGGIFNGVFFSSDTNMSSVTIKNTIIAKNTGNISRADCANYGIAFFASFNLIGDTSCNSDFASSGNITSTDPLLGPLQDNAGFTLTHALLSGSLAIDAGNDIDCLPADQRGNARPIDGDNDGEATCDIGAIEATAGTSQPTLQPTGNGSGGGGGTISLILLGLLSLIGLTKRKSYF